MAGAGSVMAGAFSHAGTRARRAGRSVRWPRLRRRRLSSPEPSLMESSLSVADGTVIIIGGAEDKVRDRVILSRFVALAGGPDATIAVISTASSLGLEAGERYRAVFGELGVKHVRPLHAVTRPQANDETAVLAVRDATGRLPDRRQPAPAVVDDRRDAPRRRDPRPLPARRGRRRHVRRRVGDVEPHDRVRGVRRDAQAPDGPDRGRSRRPARGHRRPAFPAAEPPRPAAQPDRPEPEPARARRRRGHRRRRRPRPHHGGHRARLDHGRRRRRSPRPTPGRSTATGR